MKATINSEVHNSNYILLISRVLLSAIFIWSGIGKIFDPTGTRQYMAVHGLPATGLFLVAAIAIELGGGLSLLLGYRSRLGAVLLWLFLIPATLIFHTNFADRMQQIMFMKNLAILGGLLTIYQFGSGRLAIKRD